ncbi:MAG: spermidine/putrescine ABC transporter substrate-binding protein [Hyphomonadaceae bacterium]|jgi:spermidine/putrescine transport system substrate-binding protein|nr:spermidine/putrescine ABC transporter substrate-binding protein [Hyphomonadaceae bacterium]
MTIKRATPEETLHFMKGTPGSRRAFLAALGATAAGFSLAGCGGGGEAEATSAGAPAAFKVEGGEQAVLKFYNWDTYIGETTLADFKTASNVEVQMDLFASNDELFAKFSAGNPGYDVIMPSNDYVERMVAEDLLMELDHSKIPNKANLLPEFQDSQFDPGWKHSMPYVWLILGIGYRKSKLKGGVVPDSWRSVFESEDYAGRISWLGESQDLFRLAFKYLGKSLNDTSAELVKQAEDLLIKQKPRITNFHSDDGQDLLARGEVDLVIEYNGDIAQIAAEDDDIGFVVPSEGSLKSTDCMAIPKGAPSPNNAHAFINFMLDGQVGAGIAKAIQYPTPNKAAKDLMDEAYKTNPITFPSAAILEKSEFGKFTGPDEARRIEEAMTRVKAA